MVHFGCPEDGRHHWFGWRTLRWFGWRVVRRRMVLAQGELENHEEVLEDGLETTYVGSPTQLSNYLTLKGSFSAVSKPNFANKYAFELGSI